MQLPKTRKGEPRGRFMARCMGDDCMRREYPDAKQRYAACVRQYEGHDKEGYQDEAETDE